MRYRRDSPGSTQRKAPLSTVGSLAPPAVNVMFNTIPEHFAIEMLWLRRRRETRGPEHRVWPADIFESKVL